MQYRCMVDYINNFLFSTMMYFNDPEEGNPNVLLLVDAKAKRFEQQFSNNINKYKKIKGNKFMTGIACPVRLRARV